MSNLAVYRIPLRVVDDQLVTQQHLVDLRSSSKFKDLLTRLEDIIANERDIYESTTADEYKRGRLNALSDLWQELSGNK